MQWVQEEQDTQPWLYVPCGGAFYLHKLSLSWCAGFCASTNHPGSLTLFFQYSRGGDSLSQDWASLSCSSGGKPWLNGRILIFCSMKFRGSWRRHFMGSGAVITKLSFQETRSGTDKRGSKSSGKLLHGVRVVASAPPSSLDPLSGYPWAYLCLWIMRQDYLGL